MLRRFRRPHRGADEWRTPLPMWAMGLARQLRALPPLPDGTVVEWADGGRRCWVTAIREAPRG